MDRISKRVALPRDGFSACHHGPCQNEQGDEGDGQPRWTVRGHGSRVRTEEERFAEVAISGGIPRTVIRSSRHRLKAIVDLIFDALPDLVGTDVRIFQ